LPVLFGILSIASPGHLPARSPGSVIYPYPAARHEEAASDRGYVASSPFPLQERARHLARVGADRWHASGYLGQGVRIAVLDTGFRGYRKHLGHALPDAVLCQSFRRDGNLEARDSQHGILCGEVLHALAPQAELIFANWEPDRPDQFLEAVEWARAQGARVLSCSLIMPGWSDGDGGGPFHEQLASILGRGRDVRDLLLFASAGNTAERHWAGQFRPDREGYHQWLTGETVNLLEPWGTEPISVELYGCGGARYDVEVRNKVTGAPAGRPCPCEGNPACTVVRFVPQRSTTYGVRVRLKGGRAGPFHLVILGGGLATATARGSVSCPADGQSVIAVGAVTWDGQRWAYSACGPNSRHPKPDLVASVPFPSLWRARPFSGTSAAAPQAAGLAALILCRHQDWTPDRVASTLRECAHDLGPPGPDSETGYGLVELPAENPRRPEPTANVSSAGVSRVPQRTH
jgi:subtilisin family serine protease